MKDFNMLKNKLYSLLVFLLAAAFGAEAACNKADGTEISLSMTGPAAAKVGSSATFTVSGANGEQGTYAWEKGTFTGTAGNSASATLTAPQTAGQTTVKCKFTQTGGSCEVSKQVKIIKVEFGINPVDNIIQQATPVPVSVNVTPEGEAANITYVPDNDKVAVAKEDQGIALTGVKIGDCTIKLKHSGIEVDSLDASVIGNPDFPLANAKVKSGASPSMSCDWGRVHEENVKADIIAGRDGSTWRAILISATGNYSLQAVLLGDCDEVTGPPPGNTTHGNWVIQEICLSMVCQNGSGGMERVPWYMIEAVEKHEQVHAAHFDDGFKTDSVVGKLEDDIEALTVDAASQDAAIIALKSKDAFSTALTEARNNWEDADYPLLLNDHNGPCQTAEHGVVDPMRTVITNYAVSEGWYNLSL